MSVEYTSIVQDLWNRVQSNEETITEKKKILEECEKLLLDDNFKEQRFLVQKVKLIIHKAGKSQDLGVIIANIEAETLKDPSNYDHFVCVAEANLHLGNINAAISALEYAMSIGEFPDVLSLLSLCHRRKKPGDSEKSLDYARKALKLDMGNGKLWANMAGAYIYASGRQNIVAASKAFRMAIKNGENRNADVLLNLGTVSELLLDFTEALKLYEEAMVITEGWSLATTHLGRLKEIVTKASNRAMIVNQMKAKKKKEFTSKLNEVDEFIVIEVPTDRQEPSQLAICLGKNGESCIIAITQTTRAYIRCEKTILKIRNIQFKPLGVDGVNIPFFPVEDSSQIKIMYGANPSDVPPVSISSIIA